MVTAHSQNKCNATNTTKAAMDRKQSLDVVQTVLHAGLSSLSYLRGFFAEQAFDEQIYEMSETILPYENYAAGKLVRERDKANAPSTVMRVLRRGRSKRVDVFLDWLEKGAFVALKAGHLRALQVFVHTDPADRQKVIETYKFIIMYGESKGDVNAPVGLELDGPGNPLVSVQATNSSLQTFLRQTMALCGELPDLPAKRFISMELSYIPVANKEYKPQGFVPGTIEKLTLPQSEGWEKHSKTLKSVDSFFHHSTLKVTSLVRTDTRNPPSPAALSAYDSSIPERSNVNVSAEVAREMGMHHPLVKEGDYTRSTPSTLIENETMSAAAKNRASLQASAETNRQLHPTEILSLAPEFDKGLKAAPSSVVHMKSAFRGMMHSEQITQGDTQTQSLLRPPPQPPLTKPAKTKRGYTITSSKLPVSETYFKGKPALLRTKASELDGQKELLRQKAYKLAKRDRKKVRDDIIQCQCGYNKEEDEMVECMYCGTWQHLHCYGYCGTSDLRLPDNHACYQCLLGDELSTLIKLQDLSKKRRTMHFALQSGFGTVKELADDLELENRDAALLYSFLKGQGYVVPVAGSHKASYRSSGRPLFEAVREGINHEHMLDELFDPLLHISHHYDLPSAPHIHPSSLTQNLQASQANNMPPRAKPASELRKTTSMTPVSDYGLRPWMTPFETPNRRRICPAQSQKRGLDGDSSASVSPAPKRFKSAQTELILDAGGLPSSPMDTCSGR